MNRVMPLSRITWSTAKSKGIFVLALACSLTFSACASPVAPSAKPANFYETVRSDVEGFWANVFSSNSRTYTPISKMRLFDEQVIACGESETGPFYCPLDRTVYLESAFMQSQMSTFGKFGPAMIIGHEIGHHVQNLLLIGGSTLAREIQADCLAGAWAKSANDRGLLDVGDYIQAWNNFTVLGSVGVFRDHGTVQERQTAFQSGFRSGLTGCS
jgi:predicted metalloprotease